MKKLLKKIILSLFLIFCFTFTGFYFYPHILNLSLNKTNELDLATLEKSFGGRIGVWAINTESDMIFEHRSHERFPMGSTFKFMLVSAILKKSEEDDKLLNKVINYEKKNLVTYSPITKNFLDKGMSVSNLCKATLQLSDNTAANLLIKELGGTQKVNDFAKSIGDKSFRLDRLEPYLNTAIPGDKRDTTTPEAMGKSLKKLVLSHSLRKSEREILKKWLLGNKTGKKRIRASLPSGWLLGNKTGTCGSYGSIADIGILWTKKGSPIVLTIYLAHNVKDTPNHEKIIASVTSLIVKQLFPYGNK